MPTVEELGAKVKAKYPGSYDDLPNVELGRKVKQKFPGSYDDFTDAPAAKPGPQGEGLIERGKKDLQIGWRAGASDLAHTVGNVASAIPIPASRDFGKRAEAYAQKEAPNPQDVASHQGVVDQVIQGVGQVPSQIAKFAPTQIAGKYAPLVGGAISAAGEMDKGWKPALRAGAEGAAMFYVMDKAGGIKRLAPRVAANAAIMAAPAAIESRGDIKKTTAAAITGGAFGVPSHGERLTPARAKEAVKGGMDAAAALKDEVQRYFAPQDRTEIAGVGGQVFRERLAEMHIDNNRAEFAMREAKNAFAKMKPDEIHDFFRLIEGDPQAAQQATPQVLKFAVTIRKILDDKREQVHNETGKLKDFYIDYFPHIWKDPEKAADFTKNFYASKRPLAGGGTRFRERKIPTIEEGMKPWTDAQGVVHPGLELADPNPVVAVQATIGELNRFLMAKRLIKDLRPNSLKNPEGRDILKFIPEGRQTPRGYQEVNDPAFRVTAMPPKQVRVAGGALVAPTAKPKLRPAGKWVAPEAVAQIFNNYLSKGLSQSMIYRGLRTFGNTLNQAQLGLSAFHAGFTSVDSAISRYALGIEQIAHGLRTADAKMAGKGVASIASSPIAPITNAIKGWNLKKALLDPGRIKDPQMRQMTEMVIMAGGRADVDPVYKDNLRAKMTAAFRADKPLLAALRLPGALIEASAAPLMEHFVPWQKLGVFSDMARFEMEKLEAANPSGITRDMQVKAMQKAWNSVDNRMGQLVYDNLFWDKTVKDIGMLGIRSVGWNIGTIREVVGGVKDWGSFFKDAASKGKQAEFTHRMAYVTAMPMVVGLMGAMTNKLMTGENPQSWKDYLAPRTGRKDESGHDERIWFPSYMKEIYHYATDPLGTTANKIHPMFSMVSQMLHNEDFYGKEIRNPKDSLVAQLMEEAGYAGEQLSPLSVKTAATREAGPETPWWEKAGAFVGVVPAPASLKKSAAENLASTLEAGRIGKRARTEEDDNERTALRQINAAIRAKTDPTHLISQAIADQVLSPEAIMKSAKTNAFTYSPLFKDVKGMKLEDAIDVFRLATPQERATLMRPSPGSRDSTPMMVKKIIDQRHEMGKGPYTKKQQRIAAEAASIMELMKPPYGAKQ